MLIFEGTISNRSTIGSCLSGVTTAAGTSFFDGLTVNPGSDSSDAGQLLVEFGDPDLLVGKIRIEIERFHTEATDPRFGSNYVSTRIGYSSDTFHRITSANFPWQVFSNIGGAALVTLPGGNDLVIEETLAGASWLLGSTHFAAYTRDYPLEASNGVQVNISTWMNIAAGTARPMFTGAVRIYAEPYTPPAQRFWEELVGCQELTP